MKPNDAAVRIGIHVNTVRLWTSKDFKQFFSVHAQGGDGHTRDLSDDDVRVLTYINRLKNQGLTTQDVIASLMAAQDRGFHMLPMPERSEQVVPMAVVPRQAADDAVLAERRIMHEKISDLEKRIEGLEDKLRQEKLEREQYIRELAEVRTELRIYKEGWRPPLNGVGE
jgi:DNA-binding transcriptional MerR regulator